MKKRKLVEINPSNFIALSRIRRIVKTKGKFSVPSMPYLVNCAIERSLESLKTDYQV